MTEQTVSVDMRALKALTSAALKANKAADVSTRKARILSARAVFAVTESGVIGTDGSPWAKQGDYATAIGVSAGSVTGLKRLGRALDLGIDPDGADRDTWNLLSSKAGTKEVGALFDGNETAESIREGVTAAFEPSGKRRGPSGAEETETESTRPRKVETVEDVLHVLRTDLPPVVHALTDSQQERVEAAMLKFVADNRKRRATLAAKAEKAETKSA